MTKHRSQADLIEPLSQEEAHSAVPKANRFGPDPEGDGIVSGADSYEITICSGCDNAHFWFRNAAGDYFATATFSLDQIDDVCETLQDIKTQILKRRH